MDVLVVEGSGRIGGRVYTLDDQPHRPDAGGSEFSVVSYGRVVDMVDRLGLRVIPWRGKDVQFAVRVGDQTVSAADWPASDINRVQGHARNVPPMFLGEMFMPRPSPLATHDAWLNDTTANRYDVPFGRFIEAAGADPEVIRLIESHTNASRLDDISALWKLHTAKFAEGSGGLDDLRNIDGGMSRLTDGMANLLTRPVQMNTPVNGISTENDGVIVRTSDNRTLHADYIVCSVPLPILRQFELRPALPELQARAVREIPYDDHLEVFFDVVEPFWEEDGLPSSLWTDGPLGLILHLRDAGTHGYLWLAVSGNAGAGLRSLGEDHIIAAAAEELERIRPSTAGRLNPMAVHNWSTHPWSKGHLAYRAPGQIAAFGNVAAEAHGRIHFAGEHTAVLFSGLEGAMESGERAAIEILNRAG